jgi:hypothetical protein
VPDPGQEIQERRSVGCQVVASELCQAASAGGGELEVALLQIWSVEMQFGAGQAGIARCWMEERVGGAGSKREQEAVGWQRPTAA